MPLPSIRKPSVVVTSNAGEVSAEGITFIASINSAPTVEVLLRRSDAAVVKLMSKEVLASMKSLQTSRFEISDGRPNMTVVANDGDGGVLAFTGFVAAPVLEQGSSSSSETVNVVGVDSFLNGLGMSIYGSRSNTARAEEVDQLFKVTPSKVTGDIAALLGEVTNMLVGNLDATLKEAGTPALKNVIENKHKANTIGLKAWRAILARSDVKYKDSWTALFKQRPKIGEAVAERMKDMMQLKTNSFWDVLNGLGSEFLFFYRPKMDGTAGSLVKVDKKAKDDAAKNLVAGVVRFTATDGNPTMLPLTGVIVYGVAPQQLRTEESPYQANTPVGQWPVEITPGFFQEVQAPAWLSQGAGATGFLPFATEEVTTPKPPGEAGTGPKNLDPAGYQKRREDLGKQMKVVESQLTGILQDFAEVVYSDMRLADSTATLELPLNFSVEVGIRYKFSTGEGGGNFSGFVRALRHSLRLESGATLTSATVLSLTHMTYE